MPASSKPEPTQLIEQSIDKLSKISAQLSTAGNSQRKLKEIRTQLESTVNALAGAAAEIDPVLRPAWMFDPTTPETAGRIVAMALMGQERHAMASIPAFYGSGIYAIYYTGDAPQYAPIKKTEHPIYVGKADPAVPHAQDAISQGMQLSKRLEEHAKTIRKAASTLRIEDFECRFLVVQSGFQASAESQLIRLFRPVWNSETRVCQGLGKHGDSATTRQNKRSPWDTLHPGRTWAGHSTDDQQPAATIIRDIANHFSAQHIYRDKAEIIEKFIGAMRQVEVPVTMPLVNPDLI